MEPLLAEMDDMSALSFGRMVGCRRFPLYHQRATFERLSSPVTGRYAAYRRRYRSRRPAYRSGHLDQRREESPLSWRKSSTAAAWSSLSIPLDEAIRAGNACPSKPLALYFPAPTARRSGLRLRIILTRAARLSSTILIMHVWFTICRSRGVNMRHGKIPREGIPSSPSATAAPSSTRRRGWR